MSKPNFFADLDVLNCLLGMQYDMKAEPAMDLTIDFQDLPFWFSLKSDRNSQTLTIYKQMELYSKDEKMAMFTASVVLDNTTGQAQVKAPQGLGENMAAFYIACRNLSLFAKEKGLEKLWGSSDPEQSGILLAAKGGSLTWKLVSGGDRPELTVERMFGGTIKMRPYMDDFWDRSQTEMMSLEDRIEKAESGDKFAIAKLAQAYLNGDDEVKQDAEKAAYWYRKEAELQDSEGAFNLGLLYAKGFGVERDFTQAAEWMEKAVAWGDQDGAGPAKQYRAMAENLKKAEAGDAGAMYALAGGYMALGGSLDQAGSGADYAESLKWAQKAVDAGNADGYWALALAYEHGRGVKTDDKKAVEYYKKGAELGSAACRHSYGCRLINGEGVKKDARAALKLFEQSADQGYGLACKALGHMYETGEGVEPDFDKELAYFEKACEAEPNNAELLRHVGYQYTNLMDDPEKWLHGVERAAYWLRKAAELGDGVAANGLGMYEKILELHKQGKIPAGTPLDKCMDILSKAAKGAENPKKEAQQKAERERKEREVAEQKKKEEAERAAKKKEAELKAKKESETIRETVRRAREEAKSAERSFDRRAAEIERKTSSSLNLYSSDFEPRLREIAQLSVDACRSLYNSYQDQVRRVDKICRPLVNSSRRHGEIKEIVEVIQWLNEESKIENNFSATLNNFNMGNLVQARYSPAADCVSIQRFWEDKLKQTPKTPEELREEQAEKERKAKEEAERRKKAEEAEREKRHTESKQKAAYKKAMANWNQQKAEAESKRNAELKKQLEQFEREEKAEIEKTYLSRKNTAEIKLSEAQMKEKQAQDALSSLGFFQFGEKRAQKEAIRSAQDSAVKAEQELEEAEKLKSDSIAALPKKVAAKKGKLNKELESRFPIPQKPRKSSYMSYPSPEPNAVYKIVENAGFKADILAWMEPDTLYTAQEIAEKVPSIVAAGLSVNRVGAMLTQLCNEEWAERTEDKGKNYYSLA